jgi:hypothetical protein
MTDAPSDPNVATEDGTEYPPEVFEKLARVIELSTGIDEHSKALDAAYEERMDLFLELRTCDPPVPLAVIGEATGTTEGAVRVSIAKELKRCEEVARTSTAPEQTVGRRARSDERIALAQRVRQREREARAGVNGATARRPRRT